MSLPPSLHHIAVCISAAFQPVAPNHEREPVKHSRSIKQAIDRLSNEADDLTAVAQHKTPFRDTLQEIVERML